MHLKILIFKNLNKVFANNEKELETLIQTIRIYTQDIGIEFIFEKCAMQIMKSKKRETMEGIELPDQERIRILGEKKIYKCLKILETEIKLNSQKLKKKKVNKKRVPRKNEKKFLETKFCTWNKNLGSSPCEIIRTILKMD